MFIRDSHPAGHSLAVETRGQVFSMALWEGAVQQHGSGPARRRLPTWLADGQTLVLASDASGEEQIETLQGGQTRTLPWSLGRVVALAAAPVGSQVAITNHRNELWVGDVSSAALQRVAHSEFGRIEEPAWSSCGQWLACTLPTSPRHTAIHLVHPASGRSLLATQPEFRDYSPAFSPCGKYLYFLSLRTYDPVYDSVQFELSFPRAARPYLLALQAGGVAPFEPAPKGLKDGDEHGDGERRLLHVREPDPGRIRGGDHGDELRGGRSAVWV